MIILAQIDLPQTTIDIFVIASVLLAIIGTLFLAYDLLGRENGPLRWFTLVITCGLVSGFVLSSAWRYINWEPPHPRPHLFSRKGFWNGFVAGFVIWLIFLVWINELLQRYSGPGAGFEAMLTLFVFIIDAGVLALATAAAGSIAQYTLWRANSLPHRALGAFGLVLLLVAFVLQGVQPVINILNIK
jgi:hypothetical protein